jgi:hypothetical protein
MPNGKLTRVCSWNPVRARGAIRVSEDPYNDYGVYSYKSVELLNGLHPVAYGQVVGLIESSGHVVEHEYGYRAQICVIKELWYMVVEVRGAMRVIPEDEVMGYDAEIVYEDHRIAADKMEARYHCPVTVLRLDTFFNLYRNK